jgi:hypothetical protein
MTESKVTYTPRADATPQGELSALRAAYRFLKFHLNASEKGAQLGAPDDAEGHKNDRTDTEIIPG